MMTKARLAALAIFLAAAAHGTTARAQPWNDGAPARVEHMCWMGMWPAIREDLVWIWTGFQGEPKVGQVYYMQVVIGGLGCSGALVRPEVKLPKNTTFAIDTAHPVRCFYQKANGSVSEITDGGCPQSLTTGLYPTSSGFPNVPPSAMNQFFALPPTSQPYWPLPNGVTLYINFPVVSTGALSGIASNDYLLAAVDIIDNSPGNPQQWSGHPANYMGGGIPGAGAYQGVFVFSGAAQNPRLVIPEPSVRNWVKTCPGGEETCTFSVDLVTDIYNYSCMQNAQVNATLLPNDAGSDPTAYVNSVCQTTVSHAACPGSAEPCECLWTFSGLTPARAWKWNAALTGSIAACGTGAQIIGDEAMRYFNSPPASPRFSLFLGGRVGSAVGGGHVEADPPAVNYALGASVALSAKPDAGYRFVGWLRDGADAGAAQPLAVTMDADHEVIARFEATPPSSTPPPSTPPSTPPETPPSTGGATEPQPGANAGPQSQPAATPPATTKRGCQAIGSDTPATLIAACALALARRRRKRSLDA